MATLRQISEAMNLIDEKKENLRKSFEDLQSHSPSSLNFTLKWSDFDSYFTALYSSLRQKFNLLQSPNPTSDDKTPVPAPARPELKSLCEKSDGLGLRRFIMEQRPDQLSVWAELPDAYRSSPDAAAMVLDAMEGFYNGSGRGVRRAELHSIRSGCVVMLETLMGLMQEVGVEVTEKAVNVAEQWKRKMWGCHGEGGRGMGLLCFLLLVGAFRLMDRFSMDELVDYFVIIAKRSQAVSLCRAILPDDKITDLIQKLMNKDMVALAVKLSIEFQKTDKFPPVDLLKEYKLKSKKTADEMRKNGKNRQTCTWKEIKAVKTVIKCIDDYHLESEYPKDTLVALVEKLENGVKSRKRSAHTPASKSQQPSKSQKPKPNNFSAPAEPAHIQAPGLLPDHLAQYQTLPASSYVVTVPTLTVPYAGLTVSPYGLTGADLGFGDHPVAGGGGSIIYEPQPVPPPRYDDRPVSYGGYDLPPHYRPSYYPE